MKRRTRVGVIAAALLLAGGGVSYAAIPDSDDGEIHACADDTTGDLRVIDAEASEACNTGESALEWHAGLEFTDSSGVVDSPFQIPSSSTVIIDVWCPKGDAALSAFWDLGSTDYLTIESHGPTSNERQWQFEVRNDDGVYPHDAYLYTRCAVN